MASILDGTVSAAKSVMDSAREGAEHAMDSAKVGTEQAVASTRSAFFEGVRTVSSLVSTLKKLDRDDALGWVGLARRRSPLYTVAIFGAGVMIGAGVGMMVAPTSGKKLRRRIGERLRDLAREVEGPLDQVKENVKDAEEKVEAVADKAGAAVKRAEKKIEDKVSMGAEAVKDAIMHQAGALADVTEDIVDDLKKPKAKATADNHRRHN
ncbi:Hypothetical protein A7982_10810 [Minicystis rosea]|nr:Hypothetical protein A7982_10810 [Minicystis rosea]